MKVVLAGGSGALGRRIAEDLARRKHEVVVLTRSPNNTGPHRQVQWDGRSAGAWSSELAGAALINLAGELVDRRPTSKNVDLLRRSRVEPTQALAAAAASLDSPPAIWLQASTLAIYGDAEDAVLDEDAEPAEEPPQMAGVARAWEAAAMGASTQRQVIMRTGIVLDRDTPALQRLSFVVRLGLGGRIASGRQWVSWIHIADFLSAVRHALYDDSLSGVIHVTSPNPVQNRDLMAELRRTLHRPPAPPTPAVLVRLGSVVLRTDPALALTGRRCIPGRLAASGFEFAHPELPGALAQLWAAEGR